MAVSTPVVRAGAWPGSRQGALRAALQVALACSVAWLAADVARGLVVQWATSPDASYGAILAGVAGLLLWQRRRALRPAPLTLRAFLLALVTIAAALAGYLGGQLAADLFTTRAALVGLLGGLTWFLCGTAAARAAVVPLFFLLLAIPLPELVVTQLTGSLQTLAAASAAAILPYADIPVFRSGNVLELPTTTLQVVEACSGMRSVVSLTSVGLLLAWTIDGPLRRRLVLVLACVPIAVAVNTLRLVVSGIAGETWGAVALRDPWHSLAGWATFVVSLAALWLVQRMLFLDARQGRSDWQAGPARAAWPDPTGRIGRTEQEWRA